MMGGLAVSAIAEGPIFRTVGSDGKIKSTLPSTQVGMILRKRAADATVDGERLSAHSLRSGFAVSAARAGIGIAQIQTVTRHRTLSGLQPYIRDAAPPRYDQLLRLSDDVSGRLYTFL